MSSKLSFVCYLNPQTKLYVIGERRQIKNEILRYDNTTPIISGIETQKTAEAILSLARRLSGEHEYTRILLVAIRNGFEAIAKEKTRRFQEAWAAHVRSLENAVRNQKTKKHRRKK